MSNNSDNSNIDANADISTITGSSANLNTDSNTKSAAPVSTRPNFVPPLSLDSNSVYEQEFKNQPDLESVREKLQYFFDDYHVQIIIENTEHSEHYESWQPLEQSSLPDVALFAARLKTSWSKYPLDWIAHARLKKIRLVKNLTAVGYSKAAAPYPEEDTMIYDAVKLARNKTDATYAEQVIHHEFFHLIEFNTFGVYHYEDPLWIAANDPNFHYGNGGNTAYSNPGFSNLEHSVEGFMDAYASLAIEEDRAEVYSWILTSGNACKASKWMQTDSILTSKAQLMKNYLLSISPDMAQALETTVADCDRYPSN
jgi:hypothetical protein